MPRPLSCGLCSGKGFLAAKNRYVGAISVGFGPDGKRLRRKVTGRTKAEVRDKLKEEFVDLGDHSLKNIARPVRVHAIKAVAS